MGSNLHPGSMFTPIAGRPRRGILSGFLLVVAAMLSTPGVAPVPSAHAWTESAPRQVDPQLDRSELPRPDAPAPHDELACGICQMMGGTLASRPFTGLSSDAATFASARRWAAGIASSEPLRDHRPRAPPVG